MEETPKLIIMKLINDTLHGGEVVIYFSFSLHVKIVLINHEQQRKKMLVDGRLFRGCFRASIHNTTFPNIARCEKIRDR